MTINNNFFNKLATEAADLTKTDCSSVWRQLQGNADTVIKGWNVSRGPMSSSRIQNIVSLAYSKEIIEKFLQDINTACARKGGKQAKEVDTAVKRYERDLFCINKWRGVGLPGNTLPAIPKSGMWTKVKNWLNNDVGGTSMCDRIKQMQKVLSPTEKFIQDSMIPDSDLNNLEICPTSVVDQVLLGLGELVEPETLDLIGEIMMALATALAAAAVLLATLPAGIAAIAYAAAVLAARQAATAALAALVAAGLITQAQADGLVDDMVDGVEACEIEDPVDPKPIDIGVEQGGCCFEGQSIEVPGGENGCQDIGGTWLDDLTQMGCMDLPQYEK